MAANTPPMTSAKRVRPLELLYALYVGVIFLALGLVALAGVLLLPGLARRRRSAQTMAALFLRAAGMRVSVRGLAQLPAAQCVLVANHASYLDGIVLMACLPPRFGFVIKREMARVPLAATLLRRIGSQFVERFDRTQVTIDARRVLRTAVNGHSLVFFPEGTFSTRPGLAKFHAGAFITAVRAGCAVVPAVIHGTRQALPPGRHLPRPVPISVDLLPALLPGSGAGGSAPGELRERARAAILAQLREPDLAAA